MRIELSQALAPVLRDLAATAGELHPDLRDEPWADEDGVLSFMLYGPSGSGMGILLAADEPLAERIASMADKVQEWAVDELWSLGQPATWPQCPVHQDSHPLTPVAMRARALWICPSTGLQVAEIGHLADSG